MSKPTTKASVLRITTAGSVDDGKSTLIGRLLYESHAILDDQLESLQKQKVVDGAIDLSLVTDGLKSEREQGITIDVAYKYFSTAKRKFILADAPGHVQYTRNMVTAASRADAAIVLVDARHGILEQTRRHAYLVHLLGVGHIILAINKIDAINYDATRVAAIEKEFRELEWNQSAPSLHVVPLSALKGDNVSRLSTKTPWYTGPTLLELLEILPAIRSQTLSPQLPVQLVARDPQGRRLALGTLTQGALKVGDPVRILPSKQTSEVAAIWTAGERSSHAREGQAVAIALRDERDLERGSLLLSPDQEPSPSQAFRARLVWFDENELRDAERYILRLGTQTSRATVQAIAHRFDLESLRPVPASTVAMNDIVLVDIHSSRALYLEPFRQNKAAGAFVLIDPQTFRTVAAGLVEESLGQDEHPRQGALLLRKRLADAADLDEEKTLQVPLNFLQNNSVKTQKRLFETLLELGWSIHLEQSPEAERLRQQLEKRGFGVYRDGSGI